MEYEKKIQVLMSTFNGEKYLNEQINSILNQKGVKVSLLVRDDGSVDSTKEIVRNKKNCVLEEGNNIGPGKSFFELINIAGDFEYYALSDQDDVWDNDKLITAIEMLEPYSEVPALYSSNTRLVDSGGRFIAHENKQPKITLGSSIVKNYVTGCTVVFNKKLMDIVKGKTPADVTCHDWWLNLVCLSVGGISVFDKMAHISYRQHGNNVEGADSSIIKQIKKRYNKFLHPKHRRKIIAKSIVDLYGNSLTEESTSLLNFFSGNKRNKIVFNRNFKTGSIINNILFDICVIFDRY